MTLLRRFQTFILVFGDLAVFYLGLFLVIILRYPHEIKNMWQLHQLPFLYVHILWLLVFYIGGLYEIKNFVSYKKTIESVFKTMAAGGLAAVLIFYLIPTAGITPKTNLLIDILILTVLLVLWRRTFWLISRSASQIKVLFFGTSKEMLALTETLKANAHLGYEPAVVLSSVGNNLKELVEKNSIQLIIAEKKVMRDERTARQFYETLPMGVSIADFESFYESLVEKIPVYLVNEMWFLENLMEINKKIFEKAKRVFDIIGAVLFGLAAIAVLPLVAIMIKIEGPGPVFYRQKRIGKNEEIFEIIKFRTMHEDAEKNGAVWAKAKDNRVTRTGRFLRKTRIDELPQLLNVLKGEMSFIGPRPERPEFVKELEKEIPHYAMRHLVKPGLSGWAQIKFPYGASVEDSMEKLQYDLFYIKNRSPILDLAITAKTVATMLGRKGR